MNITPLSLIQYEITNGTYQPPQNPPNSPLNTPRIDDNDSDEEIDTRGGKRTKTQGNEK